MDQKQGRGLPAGTVRRVEDLVVEDREVEGQAKADGVQRLHLLFSEIHGLGIGFLRGSHDC